MATISLSKKELEAIYFLIEAQSSVLESSTNEEYVKIANESIANAHNIIKKYCDSQAKAHFVYDMKKEKGLIVSKKNQTSRDAIK